jgi:tRNA threonylcarbamoyladenosine biosynthesis protein TsaB
LVVVAIVGVGRHCTARGGEAKIGASMRVLAVDTTSAHGSVALLEDELLSGVIGWRTRRPEHAQRLLPAVDTLLSGLDLTTADLDGIAVAVGPGTFTGLRIGIAAAEGLAYSLRRPVVGVSALEATAYRYRFITGLVLALMEAYRNEVYAGLFRADGRGLREEVPPICTTLRPLLAGLPDPPALVAGTATVSRRAELAAALPPGARIADPSLFLAEDVARLALPRLAAGEGSPLGGLKALYIRPPDAKPSVPKGSRR